MEPGTTLVCRCGVCGYDIASVDTMKCPECGHSVNDLILSSDEYRSSVTCTRRFCFAGCAGWIIVGLALWGGSVFLFVFNNGWSGKPLSGSQVLGASLCFLLVLPQVLILWKWGYYARRGVYLQSLEIGRIVPGATMKVFAVAVPGIALGIIFMIVGMLILLSSV